MNIETHHLKDSKVAEIISSSIVINNAEDGLNLLGNLYYEGFDSIIIYEQNIADNFFDLKSGIAGEILQKFSNYRVRLAIVGDFSKYLSKSMDAFIHESNKSKQINFLPNREVAIKVLSIKP